MLILGIESSCDDTSVALLDCSERGHFVIAEKTASQIDIHQKYGGVVPEIAGRMHAEKIVLLIEEVLRGVEVDVGQITPNVIAVTSGPGLITGLLVGVTAAKTLSWAKNIPLVSTNHISGHIHSVEITNSKLQITNKNSNSKDQTQTIAANNLLTNQQITFPALALVVSGGHTDLVLMRDHLDCKILGRTKDDAAGECFDKVAKLLGLPYPGGPQISKLALTGQTDAIKFPRPMLKENNYEFSFSGLKTSALYWLRDNLLAETADPSAPPLRKGRSILPLLTKEGRGVVSLGDFCASFEQAIVDVLVAKTLRAATEHKVKTVILAGGVAANKKLRDTLQTTITSLLPTPCLLLPSPQYCMDNAAMIAVAGYYKALAKQYTDWKDIRVNPHWRVDEL